MIRRWIGKRTIFLLIIAILIMSCLIWYGELSTDKEAPKRAKLVYRTFMEGEEHQ
ncbi:MAG: hypothetical protein GX329_01835 [Tissierellia bacterium]|nr:hypothetical protein [Tissierellia bacterium]